ncbi:hypothetical protein DPMN_028974 [Dreissena polymorpha]|uniref:Uncharacterized protein n=1 Tax=Dreissena polymorpha TaxID=45954 RepID=A0A9D4LVM6_DREPO|nr:hypothetical protein DPMN_028974 [Dreissena polymorpha]
MAMSLCNLTAPVQCSPDTPVPTSPKEAWCKLRFNFIVNSLTATLYSGESQLVCIAGIVSMNGRKS